MVAISRLNYEIDMRHVVRFISAPTLVVIRKGDRPDLLAGARFFAENIPNSQLVLLEGDDHLPWFGNSMSICDEMQRFFLAEEPAHSEERVLATVLMTDIVGSTETAARIGDAAWRDLIGKHDQICGTAITQHQGHFIKSLGDGLLATFTGPSRAISCAVEIREKMADIGLSVRAGLHAGECLRRDGDISGMAVNLAARIADTARKDEILTSSTVRDLVVGSGTAFDLAGVHHLKGVPGEWPLYRVASVERVGQRVLSC
jgi:class 3 adenylate cyclase